jgi:hypothetical protein
MEHGFDPAAESTFLDIAHWPQIKALDEGPARG